MKRGILVLDFGSQYTQLILKRLRAEGFFCEIDGPGASPEQFQNRTGIILSGGPSSAGSLGAPELPSEVFAAGVPVLGICYGMQLLAHVEGGEVAGEAGGEYGAARCFRVGEDPLLEGVSASFDVWMSHGDQVKRLPEEFCSLGKTEDLPCAVMRHRERPLYGLQFHPEVAHTPEGGRILANFAGSICGQRADWKPARIAREGIAAIRNLCGEEARVLVGLSGGVDSSVTAAMCIEALGSERVVPVLVDTGYLREGEVADVVRAFRDSFDEQVHVVDASERFYQALDGVSEPEKKRKVIGHLFIEVFEEHARSLSGLTHLAQGTLYPDVIESMPWRGPSATIKSHHNVGGLPEHLALDLVEPLRMMFKDDVRLVGAELGLPRALLGRHPFPGPGLAIRIMGAPSRERVEVLRRADRIFLDTIREFGFYDSTWQAFAVLLPVKTVGVMGDQRTYEDVLALRAVNSVDGMTADWTRMPYEILAKASTRIVNEVRGVNRVVYDVTSKPPGTIEWE
jgi:GMP synthase (glutamine-hydrolysing)